MSTENKTAVANVKKDISVQVLSKIESFQETGELTLPKDYKVENALKSAYIILSETKDKDNKLALEVCSKESIAEALLKMVVYGVSPIKKQCYFIVYGNKLECSISYSGNVAIAKRYGQLKSIKGNAIFKGDTFEFQVDQETGRRKLVEHKQTLESVGSGVVIGAYAMVEMNDGSRDLEVMNISQIKMAWNQGGSKGNSPAHKNFPDQMAIKTVLNRACKLLISSSDDSVLYDPLDEAKVDVSKADVADEIQKNANKESLSFNNVEDAEIVEEEEVNLDKVPAGTIDRAF
ncbi:recombinase RecT [Flavicella sediminum]|uniref:recombinase RecT n=1 Tax=Flavicella sediminum TaxID=2585141 RepID=UPI00111E1F6D|nr:RecT family recombinase [Flavicella sediminum]